MSLGTLPLVILEIALLGGFLTGSGAILALLGKL